MKEYSFLCALKKLSKHLDQFSYNSTVLDSRHFIYKILLTTSAALESWPEVRVIFLSKRKNRFTEFDFYDHDFGYSYPLFSSLLKKRRKKKRRMN